MNEVFFSLIAQSQSLISFERHVREGESALRRWRLAGLKVRAGLGLKKRDLADTETFIVRETEVPAHTDSASRNNSLFSGSLRNGPTGFGGQMSEEAQRQAVL